jgi:hypothetical protein
MAIYIDANSNWNVNFTYQPVIIPTTVRKFQIEAPSHLTIHGQMGLQHRGNYYRADGSVCDIGWGVQFFIKGPAANESGLSGATPRVIPGAVDAGNLSLREHYATAVLSGHIVLNDIGWYEIYARGNWHGSTDGAPTVPAPGASSIEINAMGGTATMYNSLYYRIEGA